MPSLMSVFDLDVDVMSDQDTVALVDPKIVGVEPKETALANPLLRAHEMPLEPSHKHNDSNSTQMSESADSSPTTTLSMTDSSPLSDPSPSSSPDSPVNLIPLKNYPATSFSSHVAPQLHRGGPETGSLERPMTSPSPRRPRNMKGLSIQPPSAAAIVSSLVPEPCSPTFIKPRIPAMRRKASQLSLRTNGSDLARNATLELPLSPAVPPISHPRALKHSLSSPHMAGSLKTSTFGPVGGMKFPKVLERNASGLSEALRPMKSSLQAAFGATIIEEDSMIKPQIASRVESEPYLESVNNEDQKSPSYPDGPVAIYDDNVFLYLEPTAQEASRFDVVINVAHEVQNPFHEHRDTHPTFGTGEGSQQAADDGESPIPDTAAAHAGFSAAFECQPPGDKCVDTPTTPKANPVLTPEYIHIPWDHNTDITPDLMPLCESIEERTRQGKTVLIHCQQGASRSASLIIAYGLYRRPDLSVNDAYHAAQAKSRWISPNMKLMYSLQDFQKEVSRKRLPSSGNRQRNGWSATKHRLTQSADDIGVPFKEPRTAPLLTGGYCDKEIGCPRDSNRLRGNSNPGPQPVSAGPASAPPNFSWSQDLEKAKPPVPEQPAPSSITKLPQRPKSRQGFGTARPWPGIFRDVPPPTPSFGPCTGFNFDFPRLTGYDEAAGISEPAGRRYGEIVPRASQKLTDEPLRSTRVEVMTSSAAQDAPEYAEMRLMETLASPMGDVFSPTATIFPRDPLQPFGRPSRLADPRSPPAQGERPIVRSIDDVL